MNERTPNPEDSEMAERLNEVIRQNAISKLKDLNSNTVKSNNREALAQLVADVASDSLLEIIEISEIEKSHYHMGPLPDPATLRGYDEVVPGSAAQIVNSLAEEQRHRHNWENKALSSASKERVRRDLIASFLASLAFVAGIYLIYLGNSWEAVALILGVVLGGSALFLGRQILVRLGQNILVESQSNHDPLNSNGRRENIKSQKKIRKK
ncbi:DUF2335 domain-containing protein [Tistrella mobilis]|uniref:DUF2335 domain-containing protein n=1 Tax=Tistrella mobilis TaxID=171437 RepID=UPI0035576348